MLYVETIGQRDSRYTTAESGAINLYATDTASGLTLGQLLISVSCRQAAAIEARSVTLMNKISRDAYKMKDLAAAMEAIVAAKDAADNTLTAIEFVDHNNKNWEVCDYMIKEFGAVEKDFPFANPSYIVDIETGDSVKRYRYNITQNNRQTLISKLKNYMENVAMTSQQDNIQLKSLVNSRDIAFKTATGLVSAIGTSQMNIAYVL